MLRHAIGAMAVALAVASADPAAAQGVRAGLLTCDVSGGIGLIIGSQKQVSCLYAPDGPGPQQAYVGSFTRFGLDIGITAGGVMVWAVFAAPPVAPDSWPAIMSERAAKRPSRPASAPMFSSAAPTGPSRCSRSRCRARSVSISLSASEI